MPTAPVYTEEYRRQAVDLIITEKLSIAEAARRLGVDASTLRKWVKKYRPTPAATATPPPSVNHWAMSGSPDAELVGLEHTGYATRLAEGRSIGSGMVEGSCKQVVSRRLKQTGARWKVRRVERMAALGAVQASDQWDAYWTTKA